MLIPFPFPDRGFERGCNTFLMAYENAIRTFRINMRGGFGLLFFSVYRGGSRLGVMTDKLCA